MKLPYQNSDIAAEGFQRLEDLATGYWYSEALFAALELRVFGLLAEEPGSVEQLAAKSGYDRDALGRLLDALATLGLVAEYAGQYSNGPLAARYLVPGQSGYWGDFLLYRRYLVPHWQRLASRVHRGAGANDRTLDESPEEYQQRTLAYVRTMDLQARLKAAEALPSLELLLGSKPRWILDVGGGAGAWCRTLTAHWPQARCLLLDLPETLAAARRLYPNPASWKGIRMLAGDVLTPCVRGKHFDLILLSNLLHAYGFKEAQTILEDCADCLAPGGTIVIHDYLADLHSTDPVKGSLYDLHMLINTYNGRIYKLHELQAMTDRAGLGNLEFFHLQSDTSILLAKREGPRRCHPVTEPDMLAARARQQGFAFARVIDSTKIVVEPWVRLKCRFGCASYGSSLSCPPFALSDEQMRVVLSGYKQALLVQGAPPSKHFHEQLLALERSLFLAGYPEALAFSAGPCPLCAKCVTEGPCRFSEKARPSLEACGVDVYATAERAGLDLQPVQHRLGYTKYVGVVLFDKRTDHENTAGPGDIDS